MYTPFDRLDYAEARLEALIGVMGATSNFSLFASRYFPSLVATIINEGKMTNGKSRTKSSKTDLIWVNTQLTIEDQTDYLATEPTDADILQGLLTLTTAGYELAIKHDPAASCHRVYLFNKVDFDGVDYGLSCFAGTPRDALHLLLFKFYTLMDGQWPDPDTQRGRSAFG
jgi:hypothetical protein